MPTLHEMKSLSSIAVLFLMLMNQDGPGDSETNQTGSPSCIDSWKFTYANLVLKEVNPLKH